MEGHPACFEDDYAPVRIERTHHFNREEPAAMPAIRNLIDFPLPPTRALAGDPDRAKGLPLGLRGVGDPPPAPRDGRRSTREDAEEFFNLVLGNGPHAGKKRDLAGYIRVL